MAKRKKQHKHRIRTAIISTICVIAVLFVAAVWYMVREVHIIPLKIDRHEYPVVGIDISSHNGDIDFELVKSDSVKFIYIKSTEGASFKDSRFERNYSKAASVGGFALGAYHFFRFDVNGTLQARNFIEAISKKCFDLPPVIDVEEYDGANVQTQVVIQRLQEMVNCMEDAGYSPIIYTNVNGYHRYYKDDFHGYPLWISRFIRPGKNIDWTFWQYSHWGEVAGIKGETDLDVFSGTVEEFSQWASQ